MLHLKPIQMYILKGCYTGTSRHMAATKIFCKLPLLLELPSRDAPEILARDAGHEQKFCL